MQGNFYCNINALSPAERACHKQLTDKLMALRRETVESENGYEFQYSPKEVSLAELAEWVVAEGKCCPFFDFHIDLEREGGLLCLRLTGAEGIKPLSVPSFRWGPNRRLRDTPKARFTQTHVWTARRRLTLTPSFAWASMR